VSEPAAPTADEDSPALSLGATLGLIALLFLPLMGGGYSGGGYQVGFVLLPLAAALCWGASRSRPRLALWVLLVYGVTIVALPLFVQGGRELWYYALHIPLAWGVAWVLLRDIPTRGRLLLPVVTLGAVLTGLYACYIWLGAGRLGYQLTGTFGLHNPYAGYLLLGWPAALLAAAQAEKALWRWVYAAAAVFLLAMLVLTYSRAAWLVLALQLLGLLAWLVWRYWRQAPEIQRRVSAAAAGLAIVLIALSLLPPVSAVLARIADFQDYSVLGRLRYWRAALEIFADFPWLGVGPGGFAFTFPQYQLDYVFYSVDPHSWPLQLLCELGLIGALLLLAIVAGLWWWTRRLWRGGGGSLSAALVLAAVFGSLLHAAVDFDYTFGATTALLGVMLAWGAHLATPAERVWPAPTRGAKWLTGIAVVLLLAVAGVGELLTLERYQLDRLRENPGISVELKLSLLDQAIRYNRLNHRTHYQAASLLSNPGPMRDDAAARLHLETCLRLNPRYSQGWALKGLLAADKREGEGYLEHALMLDPYNHPEHYYFYANLAADDEAKRERLLLGLERVPAHHPIRPDHVRPTWHELNPMWAEWYFELARLTDDPEEKALYRQRGAAFQAYWESVMAERAAAQ